MRLSIMALHRSNLIVRWFRKKSYTVKDLPKIKYTVFETNAGELVQVEQWRMDKTLYIKILTGDRIGVYELHTFPKDEKLYPLIKTKS